MSDNIVRSAIGAALDHPFAEEGFALVDLIEANVRDGEKGGESVRSPSVRYWGSLHRVSMRLHEVAAEITDRIVSVMSTRALANLWAILGADGEGDDLYAPTAPTLDRIRVDLFVVVERAVFAGLEAYAAESSVTSGTVVGPSSSTATGGSTPRPPAMTASGARPATVTTPSRPSTSRRVTDERPK